MTSSSVDTNVPLSISFIMNLWTVSNQFEKSSSICDFTNYVIDGSKLQGQQVGVGDIRLSGTAKESCDILLLSNVTQGRVLGTRSEKVLAIFTIAKGQKSVKLPKPPQFSGVAIEDCKAANFFLVSSLKGFFMKT